MENLGTILVSVASYRDPVCASTIENMFATAKHPELVYAAICQQNKPGDPECSSASNSANIRIMKLDYTKARGPTLARFYCADMLENEEYFFQIDSHTSFVQDWDQLLKDMLEELVQTGKSAKPVISHYPLDSDSKEESATMVPRICRTFFDDRGMLTFAGAQIMDSNNQFYQTPFVSGNMMFCKSSLLREVPYDPTLLCLFTGEEILMSARFYTHGYDIFTPKVNVIYHEYIRNNRSKFWDEVCDDTDAHNKVKFYLGILDDLSLVKPEWREQADLYGLHLVGSARSLSDFLEWVAIDPVSKTVGTNFCRAKNLATEEDIASSNEALHRENFLQPVDLKCNQYQGAKCRRTSIVLTAALYLIGLATLAVVVYLVVKLYKVGL